MKFKLFLLSLTIFTAGQALPANAQESSAGTAQEGMSRWQYKPNVWGAKPKAKPQQKTFIPTSVTAGAMPHSNAYIDPSIFKRVAPPPSPAQQQVQAIVSVPRVQAAQFKNEFGSPIDENAHPTQMAQSHMPAARSMSQPRVASNAAVHGIVRHTPRNSVIAQGSSLPTIQNYGSQGYSSGAFGAGTGASSHTDTQLSGRIIRH